jgi:glycine cleavage system regulatory protein
MSKHSVVTNADTITYKDEEIMSVTVTVVCEDGTNVEHTAVNVIGDRTTAVVKDELKADCLAYLDKHYSGSIDTNV